MSNESHFFAISHKNVSKKRCCACCKTRVIEHELDVGIEAVATGDVLDLGKQEGRCCLALDAQFHTLLHSLVDCRIDIVGVERILLGNGIGD